MQPQPHPQQQPPPPWQQAQQMHAQQQQQQAQQQRQWQPPMRMGMQPPPPQLQHQRPPPPPPSSFPSYSAAAAAASSSSSLPPPPMAARPAHPQAPYGAGGLPPSHMQHPPQSSLPKQQIASVLNAMTAGGSSQFQTMDGYDLANLHAMNVRYLQQVASQRSYQQHPGRRPDMAPPSTALFAAKM